MFLCVLCVEFDCSLDEDATFHSGRAHWSCIGTGSIRQSSRVVWELASCGSPQGHGFEPEVVGAHL